MQSFHSKSSMVFSPIDFRFIVIFISMVMYRDNENPVFTSITDQDNTQNL